MTSNRGQHQNGSSPGKTLAHAGSGSAAERKIGKPGPAFPRLGSPPLGIELLRVRPEAGEPVRDVRAHDAEGAFWHQIVEQTKLASGSAADRPCRWIQPQRLVNDPFRVCEPWKVLK